MNTPNLTCQFRMGQPRMTWHCGRYTENGEKFCTRHAPKQEAVRFDYDNQAWVKDGKYVRCGHPKTMNCDCYGREHEGEQAS